MHVSNPKDSLREPGILLVLFYTLMLPLALYECEFVNLDLCFQTKTYKITGDITIM